jgi:transglutaminase-like putative cysteine protease
VTPVTGRFQVTAHPARRSPCQGGLTSDRDIALQTLDGISSDNPKFSASFKCVADRAARNELLYRQGATVNIRFGYELAYSCPQPTPMVLMLNVHPSRAADLIVADDMRLEPDVPSSVYQDGFGNTCTRVEAPAGQSKFTTDGIIWDSGLPEAAFPYAREHPVSLLPANTLVYLIGSRYCETESLMTDAWRLFGTVSPGWLRVQAICDFVHQHLSFGYSFARSSKTAWEAYTERQGVCRDFAHLAITLCRCMNIPARYCTGYLGDIGVPVVESPMDFSGWFEAYLGGEWHPFDPRNNQRRIGRILIARGRDAADVAISTTFGPNVLQSFKVWTAEVEDNPASWLPGADDRVRDSVSGGSS